MKQLSGIIAAVIVVAGVFVAKIAIRESYQDGSIGTIVNIIIVIIFAILIIAVIVFAVYIAWKVLVVGMLYLNNTRTRLEIEKQELKSQRLRQRNDG